MWILDKSCVIVEPIEQPCCGAVCEDGKVTHVVRLDLGSEVVVVFEGCRLCVDDFAANMGDMLPEVATP
jgi:hypothetical protein